MPNFVTLACPSCGGKLQITNDIERFACAHCGNEHLVKRSGGVISIAPIMDSLAKIQEDTDRTAAELAISRLNNELIALEERKEKLIKHASSAPRTLVALRAIKKASWLESLDWSKKTNNKKTIESIRKRVSKLSIDELDAAAKSVYSKMGFWDVYKCIAELRDVQTEIDEKKELLKNYRGVVGGRR
jgi:hypothetical protein